MAMIPAAAAPQPMPTLAPVGRSCHFSDSDFGGGLLISSTAVEFPLCGLASYQENCLGPEDLLYNLDTLVRTRTVGIDILLARVEIMDVHLLDDHCIRAGLIVDHASSPVDGSLPVVFIAGGPNAKPDIAGALGVTVAAIGVLIGQGADQVAVNPPLEFLFGPVGGVVVELGVCVLNLVLVAVFIVLDTFAVEVGLHGVHVVSDPFPIDLVQIVRLEDHTADDAPAMGYLEMSLDDAEEDVEVRLQGRRLQFLLDGELGAFGGVLELTVGDIPEILVERLVEVPFVGGAQSWGGRT